MLFQQHMNQPIDNEVLPPLDQEGETEEDLDKKIESLLAAKEKAFKETESDITAAQKNQKET